MKGNGVQVNKEWEDLEEDITGICLSLHLGGP